jgi:hypothetical protein
MGRMLAINLLLFLRFKLDRLVLQNVKEIGYVLVMEV